MNIPSHNLAYLVGKGKSLDTLTPLDFPDHEAPVLCCNESIHVIEKLALANPVFCVQQDASLKETCRPERSGWLLSSQAWGYGKGDTYPLAQQFIPDSLGLKSSTLTAAVALRILAEAGARRVVMLAFDAHVNGDCDYAAAIGHTHHLETQKDDRFIRGGDYIERYGTHVLGLHLAFQPPKDHWNIVTCAADIAPEYLAAFTESIKQHVKTPYTLHIIGRTPESTIIADRPWADDRTAKLLAFSHDAPLAGGTLYIDPDSVIGRDITLPSWDTLTPGILYAWPDGWRPGKFGANIMAWRAGSIHRPFLDFDARPYLRGIYPENDAINASLPGAIRPLDFLSVKSYKIDKPVSSAEADITLFHGQPKPWDKAVGWVASIPQLVEQPVQQVAQLPVVHEESVEIATTIPDTALITCHYGGYNELRRNATLGAMKAWRAQKDIPKNGIFLELVCPGQEPCFRQEDFPKWLQYICIYGRERNANLFQKEALWNLAVRMTNARKLFFLDSDCGPLDTDSYFRQIFDACIPGRCVHAAWHIVHEGQPSKNSDYYSFFADAADVPKGAIRFPGMGYCLMREDYERMDGFNPYSICGSGDAVFLWECLKSVPQPMTYARRFHKGLIRPHKPQLEPYTVKGLTVMHHYHGLKSDRGYVWSRYAVQLFGHPKSYCHIDQSGLLAWNDPCFPLRDIVMEKSKMHSKEELLELICKVVKNRLDDMEAKNKSGEDGWDGTAFNEYV